MMIILLYALVAAAYCGLSFWAWNKALVNNAAVPGLALAMGSGNGGSTASTASTAHGTNSVLPAGERVALLLVWLLHTILIQQAALFDGSLHLGFAIILSATLWLAVAVLWIESLYYGLASMRLLVLPLAALCALLPMWFPGSSALRGNGAAESVTGGLSSLGTWSAALDWKLAAHLVVALAAYALLTIAALHALLMTALDRWLHQNDLAATSAIKPGLWGRTQDAVLGRLPPLLTMERLLFRLVTAGFVLLSLTVLTGVVFSEALFGRPMQFDHKTVFTMISWFIFAALLAGRHFRGWRGRVALRWTLSGFVAMLLAYVGSRFVLEVILHRV
jgi:ABC-type uncharacterized transport system permease subunit